MSILIKGMDKPTDCGLCPFEDFGYCNVKGERNTSESGVDADCPLIEVADRKTEPTHDLRTETHECVKDMHDKTEPQICDTCRYYNDYIPCGSTPSACKKADKFAKEFVDGLKKLKSKPPKVEDEPQTCDNCKLKGSTKWCNNQVVCRAYKPKDEPQTEDLFTDRFGDVWEWRGDAWYCISGDEPQTDCAWK